MIDFINNKSFDGVVAIGGGSVMDSAKVVMASLGTRLNSLDQILNFDSEYKYKVPSIFIPTTHGTGSEVTMWGTVWNMADKKKLSISHPDLYPTVAILDGNLVKTLPIDLSVITILDALSHSFESIWNKKANPKSTEFAIDAICSIITFSKLFKDNHNDLNIRNKLLEASMTAGLAFSQTTTAAAHSISYPLTIHFDIPHGVASSISLLALLEIYEKLIMDSLNIICNNLKQNINELKHSIKSIPENIIPFRLREWNVPKDQLRLIAKESFTKGRMENNIVDLDMNDVIDILNNIY